MTVPLRPLVESRLSARAAITVRYLAILIPLLALFGLALDLWLQGELRAEVRRELEREADHVVSIVAREAATPGTRDDHAQRLAAALSFADHPVRVTDARGVLARSARGEDDSEEVLAGSRRGERVLRALEGGLAVEIVASSAAERETLRELRLAALAALGATLLLAGGGGYLLAGAALRPVDEIARAAARIDVGSLDARLPARPVKDELGGLVETLNGMLARIDAGVATVRRFTEDAAHELGTPLAAIKGTADVALRQKRDAEYYERSLQVVTREAERLERIVFDLVSLARSEARLHAERHAPLDLRSVVEEIQEVGEVLASERGASLVAATGEAPLPIKGDLARLRQIGLNLVENAIRYGRPGGKIQVSCSRQGALALLVVEDDGPGIPEAERERVFDRFYRVHRDLPGSGLGLAIARAIALEHGGTIAAERAASGGARLVVRLPLAAS